jgi:hypothetical protein
MFFRFGDFGIVTQCFYPLLPGLTTKALAETKMARKGVFHWVAENLYRSESSGGYYALLKHGDKQFRRSLRTKDRKLVAKRSRGRRRRKGPQRLKHAETARHTVAGQTSPTLH